jgi:hypothetical protein
MHYIKQKMNTKRQGYGRLYDLIEYRYDYEKKAFVKVATHKYNVPKAIAYSEKKKIEFLTPRSLYTRFKIVKNGVKQYSNQFK